MQGLRLDGDLPGLPPGILQHGIQERGETVTQIPEDPPAHPSNSARPLLAVKAGKEAPGRLAEGQKPW